MSYSFKTLLLSLASVAAIQVHAEGVTVDGRFDHVSLNYNDDAKDGAGSMPNSSFQGARLRLVLQSKLTEDLSGKVRLNLLNADNASLTESKYSKFVDFAYLTHKVTPEIEVNMGRFQSLIGGREQIISGGDYYFLSAAGSEITGRDSNALYPVGVMPTFKVADQRFDVVFANSSHDDGNSQSRYMTGVAYLGSFLDKTIQPVVSFFQDTDDENNDKRQYLNIGARFLFADFELDADYLSNQNSYETWAANAAKETNSIVATLRWKASDYFHVLAKAEDSTSKQADAAGTSPNFDDVKIAQYGLAAEYYPASSQTKLRYHLAANQKTTKFSTGTNDNHVETRIIAGLRFAHDFLK